MNDDDRHLYMYNLQKISTSVLWHKLRVTGKGYFYFPTRRTGYSFQGLFFPKMVVLNP